MEPWVGIALFTLHIPRSFSLKDRRSVVRSLTERVKSRYNISASDLGPDGVWDRADLVFCGVGSSPVEMERRLRQVQELVRKIEAAGEFDITDSQQEVFSYGDL